MRHRGGAQHTLQGGPLHVGWRCREHLVYVRATLPEGTPLMCVQLSQPNTPPLKELRMRHHPFFITPLLRQVKLEVSRSIQVSRSPGCCFHMCSGFT